MDDWYVRIEQNYMKILMTIDAIARINKTITIQKKLLFLDHDDSDSDTDGIHDGRDGSTYNGGDLKNKL